MRENSDNVFFAQLKFAMKPYLIGPTCGSDDVMKHGMTRRGKQNHKCRDCGRQFVENPRAMIDRLWLERIPLAGIALVRQLAESWSICESGLRNGPATGDGDAQNDVSLGCPDG